jgi:hypothetical protein
MSTRTLTRMSGRCLLIGSILSSYGQIFVTIWVKFY